MDKTSLFEVIAGQDAEDQERVAGTRAVIAAQTRAEERFSKFVAQAKGQDDLDARLALIDTELRQIVADAADEYEYENTDRLLLATTAVLGAGHPSGCDCGFCKNKGKLPGTQDDDEDEEEDSKESSTKTACGCGCSDKDCKCSAANPCGMDGCKSSKESSTKESWSFAHCDCDCGGCTDGAHCDSEKCIETKHSGSDGTDSAGAKKASLYTVIAADVADMDTYQQETLDLSASDDGISDVGSPKIDKGKSPTNDTGGWDLPEIDIGSKRNPSEIQDIHTTPDYGAALPGPSGTGKSIDADKGIGSGSAVAPRTQQWTGTEGQANPVTSALSKWSVV